MTANRPRWDRPPVAPRLVPVRITDLRKMHLLQIVTLIVQLIALILQMRKFIHG